MNLHAWAIRWRIPAEAIAEFEAHALAAVPAPPDAHGKSEAWAQSAVRLEAAQKDVLLWRNNVGVLRDDRGVPVRYGLANESKAVNERLKSGDLIGIRPRLVAPTDVGTIIGQFVSREIKQPGWKYTGTERETAQFAWMNLILKYGGDAAFATGIGTL